MIDQKWHKKLKWAKRIGIKIESLKTRVDILPGGLFRAQDGRRSKDFRVLYQQTNKQTNKRVTDLPMRVPGLGQTTWRIVLIKKIEEHSGKKIARKSKNSRRVIGRGVGTEGMVTNLPNCFPT